MTAELDRLEDDVKRAREQLATRLAGVASADNLSDFKRDLAAEAQQLKDGVAERVKASASNAASGVLADVKRRAAANPAAALAIGAGLAWRLAHHPPVASVLIGAGLAGLFMTDPGRPRIGAGTFARARELAADAGERLEHWTAGNGSGGTEESEFADESLPGPESLYAAEAESGAPLEDADEPFVRRGARALRHAAREIEERDMYLLGAAALAMAAAVGIAYRRRTTESDE